MNKENVLITGASSGIGLELAREFAKHGHALLVTAPVEGEIQRVAQELSQEYKVPVGAIAKDLESPTTPQELFDATQNQGFGVDILVNNAGLGQRGKFWETPLERDISIIRVNIEAVLKLTKLFLPPMLARNRGRILNTASVAGFEPGPLLAVYHASKAFVLSLSEALAVELEDTDITVTALCPGPTDTDFFPKAHMTESKAFQEAKVMAPQEVAEQGYDALMRADRVFIPGAMNKTLVFKRRFITGKAQAKMNKKLYETAPPDKRKRRRGDIESKAAKEEQKHAHHVTQE
jgi:short-subunit dehydrogenase